MSKPTEVSKKEIEETPFLELVNSIIYENRVILSDDLIKLLQVTDEEPALFQPEWVEAIYGYRAFLLIGYEGFYSAIVHDAGNTWLGIQAIFPSVGVDIDYYNEESNCLRRPERQ